MAHTKPHTRFNGRAGRAKARRRREPAYIFNSERLSERLTQLLDDADPALRLYVYRFAAGRIAKPALLAGFPFSELIDQLRDALGGGEFYIVIRRGKVMMLAGVACIAMPVVRAEPYI